MTPIKVRASVQPTFTRYVFDLPELIGVSADSTKDKLTLLFDAELTSISPTPKQRCRGDLGHRQ